VKKCASCSKDLPEAALHCVFCGAKQPLAPAVQPGLAKTAFGYSANEVMDQLGRPVAPPAYQPPPSTAPYGQPQRPGPSQPPPYQQQPGYAPPQAPTVMLPNNQQHRPGPSQPPPYGQPYAQPAPYQQPYPQPGYQPPSGAGPMSGGMGINAPHAHTPLPIAPLQPNPPYLSPGPHANPTDPFYSSLRFQMIIWGAVLLAAFVTPIATDPMAFHWNAIANAPGKEKVEPLLIAAVGLLGIVLAAVPIQSLPRGLFAAVLGLAGMFVPVFLKGMPEWRELVSVIGVLCLVPGLLLRHEYTDSMIARILVTLGVVCSLVPLLVPAGGGIPLVNLFKELINAPGKEKVGPILELCRIIVVVMALLAWMPGPATGGAKIFAWIILAWTALTLYVLLLMIGHIGDLVKESPFRTLMGWAPETSYSVFIGYGLATVLGKLE
jgi:hypothetical protein